MENNNLENLHLMVCTLGSTGIKDAVDFTEKELEQIETYAVSRGIKKATAVKELAIRGLELTTKTKLNNTKLYNKIIPVINYINQEEDNYVNNKTTEVIQFITNNMYLEALIVLNALKDYTTKIDIVEALDSVIKDVSFYESIKIGLTI